MKNRATGRLRIIAGRWRRQLISVPDVPGLRPTHDRVRETLFNWLAPYLEGASCLDLFAGSGALGFEALSRGAKQVTFVDNSRLAIKTIHDNAKKLKAEPIEIITGTCPASVPPLSFAPYDIVFLDPPFHQELLISSASWLEESGYLNAKAHIYVEVEKEGALPALPENWTLHKDAKTASLAYYLFFRSH